MPWYEYIACFFAGSLCANGIPHFLQGISGNKFPTPFSKPRGVGLSSSLLNVAWGLCNFAAAYALLIGRVIDKLNLSFVVFWTGFVAMSLILGWRFRNKDKE